MMIRFIFILALLCITGVNLYGQCNTSDYEVIAEPDVTNPPNGYNITVKRVTGVAQDVSFLSINFGNGSSDTPGDETLTYTTGTTYGECESITVLVEFRVACPIGGFALINLSHTFVTAGGIGEITSTPTTCGAFDFTSTATGSDLIWSFGDGTYQTDDNSTSHVYTSNGVYVVTVIDPDAPAFCSEYEQVTVTGLPESEISGLTSCTANTLDLNSSGLSGNTYSWNMGDGSSPVSGQNPSEYTYTSPGNYLVTLTVTDGSGCSSIETETFQVGAPDLSIVLEDICETDVFTPLWVPGGGITYSWDLGDGNSSTVQYPIHTYTVSSGSAEIFTVELTMTDANGCVRLDEQAITVSKVPELSISAVLEGCNNLTYTLTPTALNTETLNWQLGGFTIPAEHASPYNYTFTNEGIQTITLIGQNGACQVTETEQVVVDEELSINLSGNMTLCEGEYTTITATILNGSGSYTYSWMKDGITIGFGPSIGLISSGEYVFKVTQAGCPGFYSETFTLDMIEKPVVSAVDVTGTTCPGNTSGEVEITLSTVPAEGYTVNGSAVQTTSTYILDGLTEGTYYLNIANADNAACDVIEQIVVGYEGPVVSIETTPQSCTTGGTLEASLDNNSGGAVVQSIEWFELGNTTAVSTSNPYTGVDPGLYTATVIIDIPSGCELTSTTAQLLQPMVNVSFENIYVCENSGTTNVNVNPSISDGISGTFTYLWQDETPSTVGTTQSVSLGAGTYQLTVTETGTGCETTASVTLNEIEEIVINPSSTIIGCAVDGSVSVYVTGGSGNFMYDWEIPGSVSIPNTGPQLTDLDVTGNYTVTVTDVTYGCEAEEIIALTASPAITNVSVSPDDCAATATVTGGTAPFTYQWILETTPEQIISVTNSNVKTGLAPGTYSVNVIDAYGCEYTSSNFVVTEPTSTLSISFKYTFGPKEEPEVEEIDEELAEAMQSAADFLMDELSDCIMEQGKTIKTEFKTSCLNPENYSDKLSLKYQLTQQQYTLFYYDRAGNLTKTVPPSGVEFLPETEIAEILDFRADVITTSPGHYNNHRLETKYDYNSLGQLITHQTPDGGISKFIYDDLQRLRFSQSARQAVLGTYSYTKYDELGRPYEAGESDETGLDFDDLFLASNLALANDMTFPLTGSSIMRTIYSTPSTATYYGEGQSWLQNRVSHVIKDEDGDFLTTNDQYKTHYSYDVHGNVKWIVQEDPVIGKNYVAYDYDLVSGNVKKVSYNEKREDRFYHRYSYDADNRLTHVETSRDDVIWDEDANYSYYLHGPLRRTETGEDDIQGTDFTYTIQGWLKAINNGNNLMTADPNQDGEGSNSFQQDIFGMSLGYFAGDFKHGTTTIFDDVNVYGNTGIATHDLYNGNISSWASHTNTGVSAESKTNISVYTYDDLNRIKSQDYYTNNAGTGITYTQSATDNFKTNYTFDRNGNLHTLKRYDQTGALLDDISYLYTEGSGSNAEKQKNQLTSVTDAVGTATGVGLYGTHTYQYDASGNLILDSGQEYIDGAVYDVDLEIEWTVTGKVKQVTKTVTQTVSPFAVRVEHIIFHYDAMDNRVGKDHIQDITEPELIDMTRYVMDASGNLMGVYQINVTEDAGTYTAELSLVEHPIYGSSRIGLDSYEVPLQTWEFTSGFAPEYFYDENGTSTVTELSNWIMSSIFAQLAGDGTTTELCQCEIKHTAFVETTPGVYDFDEGGITGTFYGKIQNGLTVGETTTGDVKLYAVLIENYLGTTNQCLVLNTDGDPVKGTEDIAEILPTSKPILTQVTGNPDYFRLFTMDENNHPTMHLINTQAQGWGGTGETKAEVETTNTPLNTDYNYGKHVAVIEDHINEKTVVYMTRYIAPDDEECLGTTEIVAYVYDGDPNSTPQEYILASIESKDTKGEGELQLSPDGTTLVYYNRKGNVSGFAHKTIELNKLVLGGDKTTVVDQQIITRNYEDDPDAAHYATYGKASVEFATDGSLYLSERGIFEENETSMVTQDGSEKQVIYYDVTDGSFNFTTVSGESQYNEIRRGKNKLYYVPNEQEQDKVNEMLMASSAPATEHPMTLTTNYILLTSLPSQPYKLIGDEEPQIYKRKVGGKHYEFTDHLGNVRAVVSDRRGYEAIASGEISNQPELLTWADFYPYGMTLPGRSGNPGDYRYSFQGQEHDDEIKGGGNSYMTEFRQYDPRIGRWISLDPISYPNFSPYNAFDNNPIYYMDSKGSDTEPPKGNYFTAASLLSEQMSGFQTNFTWDGRNTLKVPYTLSVGGFSVKGEIVLTSNMTHDELVDMLFDFGVTVHTSYRAYLFIMQLEDNWSNHATWIDNYYLKKPPLAVEAIARMIFAVPGAIIGWTTGNDWMTGEELSFWEKALGILDVIPGEVILAKAGIAVLMVKVGFQSLDIIPYLRRLPGANEFGRCVEFSSAFMKTWGKALGAKKYVLDSRADGFLSVGAGKHGVSTNGYHEFSEIFIDGKTYIIDNMHPDFILKDEYIKGLELVNTKTGEFLRGQEAWDAYVRPSN